MLTDCVSLYRAGLFRCFDELALEKVERVAAYLLEAYRDRKQVFFLGNGGSASTASHMAVDFGKGTAVPGRPRLRAISLTDNAGLLTAWANDSDYEVVFKEQLENLLEHRDLVVAISASGNSANVLRAVEFARCRGAKTVGLVGFGGGQLKTLVDVDITTSSQNYGQIEDFHLSLSHILSQFLREAIQTHQTAGGERTKSNNTPTKFFYSTPPQNGTRPAIFLDRDGVINERIVGGYVTEWEQFRFRDGIAQALVALCALELPIIVVSNQACVGKRLLSAAMIREVTDRFVAELSEQGARIDAVYYCPHTIEQNCVCRKPEPGLLRAAAKDWKLDLTRSVLIGDTQSDVAAARAVDCAAVLFPPREPSPDESIGNQPWSSQVSVVRDTSEIPALVCHLLQCVQKSV
jgi:D-sedoheptulose 7-phosphate isomerase